LDAAYYISVFGGRGSGKSWHFAGMAVEKMLMQPDAFIVCCREYQKTLAQSAKRLIEQRIRDLGVGSHFNVGVEKITTPYGGLIYFTGLSDQTAESLKSLEGADVCWVEEAQTLTERSLQLLRPSIRKEGSTLWFSFNPRFKRDAVDIFTRQKPPENMISIEVNWKDNPWWNSTLEAERLHDREHFSDTYEHVWEGAYQTAVSGSYFGDLVRLCREEGRITKLARDPLLPIRLGYRLLRCYIYFGR
jgi:phage terminase large subunit